MSCDAVTEINLGVFNVGNVDRIRVTITKDGVAWNLTSGTVVFRFKKPDRTTTFDRNATAESASGGIFYYDTLTTDFDTAGDWTMTVIVTDGTVYKKYPYEIAFTVVDESE